MGGGGFHCLPHKELDHWEMLAFVHQATVIKETLMVMSYFRTDIFFTSQQRLFLTNCHLALLGFGSVKTCSWHQVMEAHPRWTKAAMENVSWPVNETTELLRDQPPQTNKTKPGKAGCFAPSSLGCPKSPDPRMEQA